MSVYALKETGFIISKIISSAHFPGRFLNWFWISDCWHLRVELKSSGQHLLQCWDLLHGIAVESQTSSFSYCSNFSSA